MPKTSSVSDLSVVILAGGRGSRLGRDKATLEIGGETLIERSIRRMSPLSDDIVVVARARQRWGGGSGVAGARLVSDLWPYKGVLAGIAAGLIAARRDWCFVMACDMPCVNPNLVRQMLSVSPGSDTVVPRLDVRYVASPASARCHTPGIAEFPI